MFPVSRPRNLKELQNSLEDPSRYRYSEPGSATSYICQNFDFHAIDHRDADTWEDIQLPNGNSVLSAEALTVIENVCEKQGLLRRRKTSSHELLLDNELWTLQRYQVQVQFELHPDLHRSYQWIRPHDVEVPKQLDNIDTLRNKFLNLQKTYIINFEHRLENEKARLSKKPFLIKNDRAYHVGAFHELQALRHPDYTVEIHPPPIQDGVATDPYFLIARARKGPWNS